MNKMKKTLKDIDIKNQLVEEILDEVNETMDSDNGTVSIPLLEVFLHDLLVDYRIETIKDVFQPNPCKCDKDK